jgi:hypothetical protein
VPQMIIITFDDAVNDENWDLYQDKLFPPGLKVLKAVNMVKFYSTFIFLFDDFSKYFF